MVATIAAVLFITISAALAVVGGRMIDRTRAQTAADAVALASLQGGRRAALYLVERYDAELVAYSSTSDRRSVTVVVRVGEATASAAATDAP
jgi:hypothetical protein